jgi:O-antigen ligase
MASLNAVDKHGQIETISNVLIVFFIFLFGVYSLISKSYSRFKADSTIVRFLFIYYLLMFSLQLFVHGIEVAQFISIFGYTVNTLIIIKFISPHIYENLEYYISIILGVTLVCAIPIILSIFGVREFLLLPITIKENYSVINVMASSGILEHPLYAGSTMMIGLIISVYRYYIRSGKRYILSFILLFIALMVTQARGAMLGTGIGVIFLYIVHSRMKYGTIERLGYVIIGLLGSSFSLLAVIQSNIGSKLLRLEYSLSGREIIWPWAIDMILKSPIVGYGLDSAANIKYLYAPKYIYNDDYAPDASFHNNFIDVASDYGLVVLIVYVSIFVVTFKNLFKMEYRIRLLLIPLLSSFIVSILFVNYQFGGVRFVSVIFTIIIGLSNQKRKSIIK